MYTNVLVPTDGSEPAERAAEQAIAIAEKFDATLHVLFVVDVEENYPFSVSTEPVVETLQAEGEKLTAEIASRAPDGVETASTVTRGSAHEEIVDYANDHGVELIVLGTHGRRGLDRYLLGSVTERVTRSADCSVLITRA